MSRLLYRLSYATVFESPVKLPDTTKFVKHRREALSTVTLRVRTYECDAYGHVNNAVYLNYLEYARDEWLRDHDLDYQGLVASGAGIFVAEARLVYRSPALPGEELTIATQPSESGGAWVVLRQQIAGPQGRPILEAEMKLVWVGPQGRPTRIPADWKAKLLTAT